MSSEEQFEAFMQKVLQRPLPNNPMARIRTLARELALGYAENFWGSQITFSPRRGVDEILVPRAELLKNYFERRWDENYPDLSLLGTMGFLIDNSRSHDHRVFEITSNSLALVEEVEPVNLFISYRRKESSAFALLVLARLKEFGLNAFLDMSLKPGDNWHAYIKEQIQHHDYFILLLGKETLESSVVRDEISWAIEAGAEIIPVWHGGFEYKDGEFDLSPEIQRVLRSNHSIRVLEESALAYNNAIVELLNRFGITP